MFSWASWFKPKNKHNVVVPSKEVGPLQGIALIREFSTEDEPKLKDYPKEAYKVYWETFLNPIPGGYHALVRFYSYSNGLASEHDIVRQSVSELRNEVSNLILSTMSNNKR